MLIILCGDSYSSLNDLTKELSKRGYPIIAPYISVDIKELGKSVNKVSAMKFRTLQMHNFFTDVVSFDYDGKFCLYGLPHLACIDAFSYNKPCFMVAPVDIPVMLRDRGINVKQVYLESVKETKTNRQYLREKIKINMADISLNINDRSISEMADKIIKTFDSKKTIYLEPKQPQKQSVNF